MKKNIILLLVCITVALSVSAVSAGLFGDDVTVKDVVLDKYYQKPQANSQDYIMIFDFGIVPTKDINNIRSIWLRNLEITYSDYNLKFEHLQVNYYDNVEDNLEFKKTKNLEKDNYYGFYCKLIEHSVPNRDNIKHIKADIMVNTTTEDNIVIGHIDHDVSMSTVKNPTGNTAQYNY